MPTVYRFGESRRVMNETREENKSRGKEILWSSVLWVVGGFSVYVLSYGPAVWIEPKIESKKIRSIIEAAYIPAAYVLFETPLRPFAEWYVGMWVDVSPGAK